jgi:hypothetical protein
MRGKNDIQDWLILYKAGRVTGIKLDLFFLDRTGECKYMVSQFTQTPSTLCTYDPML